MSKKVMKEPVAKKEKATGKRNRRVAAGLSVAMLVSPLSSVMAADVVNPDGTVNIEVSSHWVGHESEAQLIRLLADGEEIDTVTLNAESDWSHVFNSVKVDENVEYAVMSANMDGYSSHASGDVQDGFDIVNLESPDNPGFEGESIDVAVSTEWTGDAGEEANLNLLVDGLEAGEVELTPETGWDYTFENLPVVTKADGEEVVYTITEDDIDGYESEISGDQATGFTVSNTQVEPEPVVTQPVEEEPVEPVVEEEPVVEPVEPVVEEEPVVEPVEPVVEEEPVVEPVEPVVEEEPVVEPVEPVVEADSKFVELYKSLDLGISYKDAVAIMGSDGTMVADKQGIIGGKDVPEAVVYTWATEDGNDLSLGFIDDKLVSKSLLMGEDEWLEYDYQTETQTDTGSGAPGAKNDEKGTPKAPDTVTDDGAVTTPVDSESDVVAPNAPTVDAFNEGDTFVKGVAERDATITVTFEDGTKATAVSNGALPKKDSASTSGNDNPKEIDPNASVEFKSALDKAGSYLDTTSMSKEGLFGQLVFEEFSEDAARYAVDRVETDWNENALEKGKSYQEMSAMSKNGLYDQLIFESFTPEQATYAVTEIFGSAPSVDDVSSDGDATVDANGSFSVAVPENVELANGDTFAVTSTDNAGNVSNETIVTVGGSPSDAQTVTSAEKVEEGKKLADTATNTANLIAIGAGLLLAAGAGLFFVNRRRQATDVE